MTTSTVSQPNSQGNGDLEATPQPFTHQPSQDVRKNPPRETKAPAKFVDYVTYASRHLISEAISNHSFQNLMWHFLIQSQILYSLTLFKRPISSLTGRKPCLKNSSFAGKLYLEYHSITSRK
ncbi:hypothetical protein COP1_007085 [Malus domestica]